MKPLYLIDGTAYIYRAFYAVRRLTASDGHPTNAIFGFAQMMLRVLKDFAPERAAIVFDSKEKNFRHGLFPDYKANRSAPPEGLVGQIPAVHEMAGSFGIPVVVVPGVEADDVLGAMALREAAAGGDCVIVTGDKDLMQLVSDRITLYDPVKGKPCGREGVRERFGVDPERVADVLALAGDSSDNIPGVAGVGEVTASKLVSELGTIEEIYADLSRVNNGSLRKKLESSRDAAFLSKRLAAISAGAVPELPPESLAVRPPDAGRLAEIFARHEFKALAAQLPQGAGVDVGAREHEEARAGAAAAPGSEPGYRTVLDEEGLRELEAAVLGAAAVSIDTETTSLEPMRAHLVGVSVGTGDGRAFYIPLGHRSLDAPRQLRWETVRPALARILAGRGVCAHNAKYDYMVLARHGLTIEIADDTLLMAYLFDPEGQHSLKYLARTLLGREMQAYDEVVPKRAAGGFADVPVETASRYSCADADMTFRLAGMLAPRLKDQGLDELYRGMELPLVPVLAGMEMAGVRIDTRALGALSAELASGIGRAAGEIHALAGTEFNISSPKQLADVLFGRLGLRVIRRTKTGPSTDSEVLEELAAEHEIAGKVLAYRSLEKLRGTYVEALPALVNPATGRIHCSFNQAGTATGRLSSSQPNLQNIPVRTPMGRMIREAFRAGDGFLLLSADYSQIELRVLAHFSGDPTLIRAFESGEDIHRRTASEIFGVEAGSVTPEMRRAAKTINFGIVYGMGAFRLARELGIKRTEAQAYIDGYFARIPGVRSFIEATVDKAGRDGFVTTLYGRKRRLDGLNSGNGQVRSSAERIAVNTPIQGSAADIMKMAMLKVAPLLSGGSRLLLQVHDELLFETPADSAEELKGKVIRAMEGAAELSVPLKVDAAFGPDWAAAH